MQLRDATIIQKARRARGLTQTEVADLMTQSGAPSTQNAVSNYETGKRTPAGKDELRALADVLGLAYEDVANYFADARGEFYRNQYLRKVLA